jgi:hypothetical protein
MIKLRNVILISLLLFGKVAYGQALLIILFGDKLSTEKFQMGINFAMTASDLPGLEETKLRTSWAFGALGEIKLNDTWSLQSELTIKTPGGARVESELNTGDSSIDSVFSSATVSRESSQIALPVYLKFKTKRFGIAAGPQVGYLTKAKDRFEGTTIKGTDLTVERDAKENLNRWDAGITGLVEYYFAPEKKMKTLRLGLKYYYGLTDILKNNKGDAVTNSVFLLTLGIPVGGG